MNEVKKFIESVRDMKHDCPMTIIVLPPCTKGLPLGSYNLSLLLESIAMNLEGKKPLCRKGTNHDRPSRP